MFICRNHETREISMGSGFLAECNRKFGENSNVWKFFNDAFDYLPFSALIDDKVFCVHGGISPQMITLDQLRVIDRFKGFSDNLPGTLVSDLMWSDPDTNIEHFRFSERGEGFLFGEKALDCFLNYNALQYICRAHQLAQNGFMKFWDGKLYTVWSAPNYCYRFKNAASVMEIDEKLNHEFKIFHEAKGENALPPKTQPSLVEYFE
jgi:diadenosine tetraphosphatase ApaH/serine/threonine PP2A family protein phosphatase